MSVKDLPEKNIKKAIIFWILTLGYMALVFYLSSRTFKLPKFPDNFDKIVHIGIYIPLSFLLYTSLKRSGIRRYVFILSVLLTGIYGITDELHQSYVPGRHSSHWDFIADFTGAFIGSAAARFLKF